jgi:hypothetical protein
MNLTKRQKLIINEAGQSSVTKILEAGEPGGGVRTEAICFHNILITEYFPIPSMQPPSHWKEIEIISCRGRIDLLLSKVLASPKLTHLSIRQVFLSNEIVTQLSQGLGGAACRIRRLSLFENKFESGQSLRIFSEALSICHSLRELDLSYCSLKDQHISNILTGMRPLRHLDISGNYCRVDGIAAIVKILLSDQCILESLDLTNQHPGECGGSLNIELLGLAIMSNTSLRNLDLSFNMLYDDDISNLVASLSHNTSCKILNLMSNQLTSRGACTIAKYLPKWEGVQRLSLSCNKIGEHGAEELLKGLEKNFVLEHLDMNRGFPVADRIRFYLVLNGIGRRILHDKEEGLEIPLGLWPFILAKHQGYSKDLSASVLYYMIRGPALFSKP